MAETDFVDLVMEEVVGSWQQLGFRIQRALGGLFLPILAVVDPAEAVLWWQRLRVAWFWRK